MTKLYSGDTFVFDIHTPNGLLNKVWFEILYYLCRRGQENLRTMTKETFQLAIDSTGNRYIFQKVDEMDKNHRDLNAGAVSQGRMYEQKGMKHCFLQEFSASYFCGVCKCFNFECRKSFLSGALIFEVPWQTEWWYNSAMAKTSCLVFSWQWNMVLQGSAWEKHAWKNDEWNISTRSIIATLHQSFCTLNSNNSVGWSWWEIFDFYNDTYQLFNSKVNTTPFSWSTSLH